jgi:hypothetical protein
MKKKERKKDGVIIFLLSSFQLHNTKLVRLYLFRHFLPSLIFVGEVRVHACVEVLR